MQKQHKQSLLSLAVVAALASSDYASSQALEESTQFLEEFVCYHLGKQPRSLKFLRQIRQSG